MSTKSTKTIDDLGIQTYTRFEDDKAIYEEIYISESKNIAMQLGTDVFEPILISEYNILFELNIRGAAWGMIPPPKMYNQQKKRLFTYQLAPKLGPVDLIDMQIGRIDAKREQEKKKKQKAISWEEEQERGEIDKEADKLIQLMQDINLFNTILTHVNAERYRYSKG